MRKAIILLGISVPLAGAGTRATMMKPEVASVTDDMRIDVAAYLASLNP